MKIIITNIISVFLILISINIQAKGVAAGVVISNTVVVTADGIPDYGIRATTEFTVAEILNLDLVSLDSQAVSTLTPANNKILSFQLTNTGNGTESFLLTSNANITGDDFNPIVNSIWIETNNIQGFQNDESNSTDSQYLVDINKITLAADDSVIIYILSNIPSSLDRSQTGDIVLSATSDSVNVSQYSFGETIASAGDNGVALVLLKDKGKAEAVGSYITSSLNLDMKKTVIKIVDPYNKERIMPGTAVTYKISINVIGDGVIDNLVITDPTPHNMRYKVGSIILNNISLSDAADNDQGDFGETNTNTATLNLGEMRSPDHFEVLLTYIIE